MGVKKDECRMRRSPLLALQQGGVAAPSNKTQRSNLSWEQTGWFTFGFLGKPPRPSGQWRLRKIFLNARPPLLAVMQGGDYGPFQTLQLLSLPSSGHRSSRKM